MWAVMLYNAILFLLSGAAMCYGVFVRGWHPAWLLMPIVVMWLAGGTYTSKGSGK